MVAKSGEVRNFEISRRHYFENGRIIRSDWIARDITDSLRLERKLKEYLQQLEKKVDERTVSLEYANRQLSALTKASSKFTKILYENKLLEEAPKILTRSLDFDRAYLFLGNVDSLHIHSSFCIRNRKSG